MPAGRSLVVLVLTAVTATVVTVSACSAQPPDVPARPTPSQPVPSAVIDGEASLAVGATATYSMLTHCGVENARINGRWWHAVPPLYGAGGEGVSPPAGWGDPFQQGTLTLQSASRAVFEARGERVILEPSPTGEPIRICR